MSRALRPLEEERRPARLDRAVDDLGDLEVRVDLGTDPDELLLALEQRDPGAQIAGRGHAVSLRAPLGGEGDRLLEGQRAARGPGAVELLGFGRSERSEEVSLAGLPDVRVEHEVEAADERLLGASESGRAEEVTGAGPGSPPPAPRAAGGAGGRRGARGAPRRWRVPRPRLRQLPGPGVVVLEVGHPERELQGSFAGRGIAVPVPERGVEPPAPLSQLQTKRPELAHRRCESEEALAPTRVPEAGERRADVVALPLEAAGRRGLGAARQDRRGV